MRRARSARLLATAIAVAAPAAVQADAGQHAGDPAPTIALTATAYKSRSRPRVELSWTTTRAVQVQVLRNGVDISTAWNEGVFTDAPRGGGAFTYRICETGGGACSNPVTVFF